MSRPIRIGLHVQPQHATYAEIRDAVRRTEDAGADIIYNWDHFYPLYGDADGAHFEAWTMLGAWAEQTSRIEIGCLVTCNSYRNPELLAVMARTTDHISNGRLILGIGSGWFERDYDEYGYEFSTAGGRLDILGEALPRIESRWAKLNPAPTRKIPVLIGGGGEKKTLRFTAKHADIWHGFGDIEQVTHKCKVLDDWCAEIGRDPKEIERSVGVGEASPKEFGETALAAGITQFTIHRDGDANYDTTLLKDWIAWRDAQNG